MENRMCSLIEHIERDIRAREAERAEREKADPAKTNTND